MGMVGPKEKKKNVALDLMQQVAKAASFVKKVSADSSKPVGPGTDEGVFGMFKKKKKPGEL